PAVVSRDGGEPLIEDAEVENLTYLAVEKRSVAERHPAILGHADDLEVGAQALQSMERPGDPRLYTETHEPRDGSIRFGSGRLPQSVRDLGQGAAPRFDSLAERSGTADRPDEQLTGRLHGRLPTKA